MFVPLQPLLLPQATEPATPAANATVKARQSQFFIIIPPYRDCTAEGSSQTPLTLTVPGPHVLGGG